MSHIPVDPTKPKDPVLVARRRPDTVTLASVLMIAGGVLGLLNAVLVMAAAGSAASAFRSRAERSGATAQQVDQIAAGLASWSMTAGLTGLVLSVVMLFLARRVRRGSQAARVIAVTIVGVSILCGLGWSSFTVRGSTNLKPDGMDPQIGRGISDALGFSTSGPSTYIGGGLTCLQVLGYIVVLGLLLWPASHPYFRRAPAGAGSGRPAPERPVQDGQSVDTGYASGLLNTWNGWTRGRRRPPGETDAPDSDVTERVR